MLPKKLKPSSRQLGNAISCVFRWTFSVNKYEGKRSSWLFILPISSVIGKIQCLRLEERVKERRHQGGYKQKARRVRSPFRRANSVTTPSKFFLLACACVCAELKESSVSRLSAPCNFSCRPFMETKVLGNTKTPIKLEKFISRPHSTNKMLSRNNNTTIFPSFRLYARAYVRTWTLGNFPGNVRYFRDIEQIFISTFIY